MSDDRLLPVYTQYNVQCMYSCTVSNGWLELEDITMSCNRITQNYDDTPLAKILSLEKSDG